MPVRHYADKDTSTRMLASSACEGHGQPDTKDEWRNSAGLPACLHVRLLPRPAVELRHVGKRRAVRRGKHGSDVNGERATSSENQGIECLLHERTRGNQAARSGPA